jgi:tRNA U34 5-carboxymethylaminomethyl modifying GTPase MnmE/TrmE
MLENTLENLKKKLKNVSNNWEKKLINEVEKHIKIFGKKNVGKKILQKN